MRMRNIDGKWIVVGGIAGAVIAWIGVKALTPRGIRNNNPGNIRYTGTKWDGLADPPADEKGFCRFNDAFHGVRALMINTLTLEQRGVRSLLDFATKWAPASDGNDPTEYARVLAAKTKAASIYVRYPFTAPESLKALARGVTIMENGINPYNSEVFDDAAIAALKQKGYIK